MMRSRLDKLVDRICLPEASAVLPARRQGFTLIELILLMALLSIVISLVAPRLAAFFRGRSLDSEARQLLALARHGQSRAVSEGIPMRLWLDTRARTYGLEAEPGYTEVDTNAVEFGVGKYVEIALTESASANLANLAANDRHAGLPALSFLPDGSIGEQSPQNVMLRDQDGGTLWLTQSRSRLNYELRNQTNLWNDARW
jgi:type II secretion system protein H